MFRLFSLLLLFSISINALADGKRTDTGTTTATEIKDGQVLQRLETKGEPNPLPVPSEELETLRSQPIPPSGRISTNVRWTSYDPVAIGQDVTTNATGRFNSGYRSTAILGKETNPKSSIAIITIQTVTGRRMENCDKFIIANLLLLLPNYAELLPARKQWLCRARMLRGFLLLLPHSLSARCCSKSCTSRSEEYSCSNCSSEAFSCIERKSCEK